jgi:hypothetical protein
MREEKKKEKKRISKKTCLSSFLTENVRAVNGMNHRWVKCQFSNHRYATCKWGKPQVGKVYFPLIYLYGLC